MYEQTSDMRDTYADDMSTVDGERLCHDCIEVAGCKKPRGFQVISNAGHVNGEESETRLGPDCFRSGLAWEVTVKESSGRWRNAGARHVTNPKHLRQAGNGGNDIGSWQEQASVLHLGQDSSTMQV